MAVVGMLLTLFVLAGEFGKGITLPPDPAVPTVPTTTGSDGTDAQAP